ncbi:LysR family transcriptional regulator [Pseudomonas graminis]|uniref:LysR family transcriptional regulator n=1 Tax=Pseudomonas graminis TaxID=158627 RepID=UPI003C275E6F
MIDWDNVRFFLAVARGGSVRSAAARLKVNHATVLRRISQFEEELRSHLFEKTPAGYRLTEAGYEILELAEQMEATSNLMEARIFGRDQSLRCTLRFTLAPTLATHLLMPGLAEFCQLHPEIEIELLSSFEPVNLTMRQADVALRLVYDGGELPPNLYGLKGPDLYGAVYVAKSLIAAVETGPAGDLRWVAKSQEADAINTDLIGDLVLTGIPFKTTDAGAQLEAVRQGIGMAHLPCFIGDADEALVRVPISKVAKIGTLWLLTQGETHKTTRVRVFTEFVSRKLADNAPLLMGLNYVQ